LRKFIAVCAVSVMLLSACAERTRDAELSETETVSESVIESESVFETEQEEFPAFITIKGEQYAADLTALYLRSEDLTDEDIKPLKYMTNLTDLTELAFLYIRSNPVSDVTSLSGLTKLISFMYGYNQIPDEQIDELQSVLVNAVFYNEEYYDNDIEP